MTAPPSLVNTEGDCARHHALFTYDASTRNLRKRGNLRRCRNAEHGVSWPSWGNVTKRLLSLHLLLLFRLCVARDFVACSLRVRIFLSTEFFSDVNTYAYGFVSGRRLAVNCCISSHNHTCFQKASCYTLFHSVLLSSYLFPASFQKASRYTPVDFTSVDFGS